MSEQQRDITRTFLAVLSIAGLIGTSLWILRPFLGAAIWAVTIVTATWPLIASIQRCLWGRRSLAVSVMTLILVCFLVVPLWLTISALVSNADVITGWIRSLSDFQNLSAPGWLGQVPFVGADLVTAWNKVAVEGSRDVMKKLAPYGLIAVRWLLAEAGGLGGLVVQFLLTVVFAALLYSNGEHAASWMKRFGRRLAGSGGEHSVVLAGQAVRGVALGVVITALAQSLLAGVGLAIAQIPFPAVLTALMFILAIAQIGPIPVMIPAVVWLYSSSSPGWGTFLLLWTLVVGTMDNFLRPVLIKRGADLPLLLIFSGVVGGLIAFGLIGIFVGPVVLAVAHTLLAAWVDEEIAEAATPSPAGVVEEGPAENVSTG